MSAEARPVFIGMRADPAGQRIRASANFRVAASGFGVLPSRARLELEAAH
jgi:hypothetical protein